MGHKRKRQAESAPNEEPAAKKQETEKATEETAAERRQRRSERRTKKAHESKQNASRSSPKDKSKHEPKREKKEVSHTRTLPATTPELVQATTATSTTDDHLASGKDFVSLSEPTDTKESAASTSKPTSKSKKPKQKVESSKVEDGDESKPPTKTADSQASATRFIAFVGNLPYSTTTAQLTAHFRKLSPTSIRHPTDKTSKKSKGYAFLEFDNYSAMKTCLKVYHHSMFDPERTSKLPEDAFDENGLEIVKPGQEKKGSGRRINVELTAGGGGKGEGRKEKIRVKNTRLEEQRDRRREADIKAERAKNRRKGGSDVNRVEIKEKTVDARGDIHPSRLKRVQA